MEDVRKLMAGLSDLAGRIGSDEELAELFLLGLARLALAADDADLRAFVEATADDLRGAGGGFDLFVYETRSRLDELLDPGDWATISRRRSALRFLQDLYAGTPLEPPDVAALDQRLRERCGGEGFLEPDEIPDGMPEAHWWWWCPRSA